MASETKKKNIAIVEKLVKTVTMAREQRMIEIAEEESEFFKDLETKGLKQHQLHGIRWMAAMYDCGCNCILGDEMGLGKTAQAISLIMRNTRVNQNPVLIIAPLAVLKGWEEEFNKWASKDKVSLFIYHGERRGMSLWDEAVDGKYMIVLTTPGILVSDFEVINAHCRWGLVVVDEAHIAKNSASIFSRHLESIDTESFLLLTGTIVHNNIEEELTHMLGFVIPPVARDAVTSCILENSKDGLFIGARPSASLETVAHILYCFMLRRLIQDTPGISMPPKITSTIYLSQTALQKKMYAKGCNHALCDKHPFLALPTEDCSATTISPEHVRLVCENSNKMKFIMEILPILLRRKSDEKHKVLIFSNSLGVLYLLLGVTSSEGYSTDMITGEVNDIVERKQRLDRFNGGGSGPDIMLLSTKAMGQGVQLTGADTVIFYDHHDNPQNDNQAEARAYRITQRKPVLVLRLVTRNTSEAEAMASRVKRKREIQKWMEFTRASVIIGKAIVEEVDDGVILDLNNKSTLEHLLLFRKSSTQYIGEFGELSHSRIHVGAEQGKPSDGY
jgi:SNF2 family DNA or RNA helicase